MIQDVRRVKANLQGFAFGESERLADIAVERPSAGRPEGAGHEVTPRPGSGFSSRGTAQVTPSACSTAPGVSGVATAASPFNVQLD